MCSGLHSVVTSMIISGMVDFEGVLVGKWFVLWSLRIYSQLYEKV